MGADADFNALQFEKKLTNLKDSQDSINATCSWCLEHKQHHKRIVNAWLSVLKRVKYSKRKNFDFVESWGTALQKATTLVRDVKVKHKILRIFKIWEQRAVYSEEFISDLSGLISVTPSTKKADESSEPSAQIAHKIRICTKLDNETDRKLQLFKQHGPQMMDLEALMASLKDRAHVDDVEKEMDEYVKHLEGYIEALRYEIRARISHISLLSATDAQLEKDRKDVKVVTSAYRSFSIRVKNFRKKLEEKKASLNSPIPSPDVNAPSPSPDSELELPDHGKSETQQSYPDAGFYQQTSIGQDTFMNNGFSSFLDSGVNFNLNSGDLSAKSQANQLSSFFASVAEPPPPPAPVPAPPPSSAASYNNNYNNNNNQMPLAPPPLPPFTNEVYSDYSGPNYGNNANYGDPPIDSYQNFSNQGAYTQSANYANNPYNPEEDVETWNASEWCSADVGSALQTPISPPPMEKEGFLPPIEYHEEPSIPGAVDVDHRLLVGVSDKKEIDHRNLISLTGSPKNETTQARKEKRSDWRSNAHGYAFRHDNNESIDMELSDDEAKMEEPAKGGKAAPKQGLLPPPPFPADVDANSFLEELDESQYSDGARPEAGWRRGANVPLLSGGRPQRRGGRMNHMMSCGRGEFNKRGPNNVLLLRPRFRGVGGKFPARRGGSWPPGNRGGRGGGFAGGYHKSY